MYRYDHYDQAIVDDRVKQFRDQTNRYLAGTPVRGRIPSATPAERALHPALCAHAAHRHSLRSALFQAIAGAVGHRGRSTTAATATSARAENLQLNWPKLEDVPEILAELAKVEMHAIQTSGNCIRNVTSDQFAGVSPPMSSPIRAPGAKSCASGRPSTRSSPSCRASSRSP